MYAQLSTLAELLCNGAIISGKGVEGEEVVDGVVGEGDEVEWCTESEGVSAIGESSGVGR